MEYAVLEGVKLQAAVTPSQTRFGERVHVGLLEVTAPWQSNPQVLCLLPSSL